MNVLIVEDEALAARRLERLLVAALGSRLGRIVRAETVDAARQSLREGRIDLVLLDLDLDGADGFAVLGATGPRVIVVSARTDRAIDAFDRAVADFVSKPVSAERLARALARAEAAGGQEMSLVVRSAGRIDLAPASAIVSLSGADDYVEVAMLDGRLLLHDATLDELEKRLPQAFIRIHRSHIANTAHAASLKSRAGGRRALLMTDGSELPVSRRRAGAVARALKRKTG